MSKSKDSKQVISDHTLQVWLTMSLWRIVCAIEKHRNDVDLQVRSASATTVPTGMPMPIDEKHAIEEKEREKITDGMLPLSHHLASLESEDGTPPTQEDLQTLRKVSAGMPWVAIGMCLIE